MSASNLMNACELHSGKEEVCRDVLDDLQDWFGIPAAVADYVSAVGEMPMFACFDRGETIGFISVKLHTPYAGELYVLGMKRRFHRQGVGRVLIDAALQFAARAKLRFVTVKTSADSHPDPNYAATRRFYQAMGFVPIEVMPKLWGPANPCLLLIRPVDSHGATTG